MKRFLFAIADDEYDRHTIQNFQKTRAELISMAVQLDIGMTDSRMNHPANYVSKWCKKHFNNGGEMVLWYLRKIRLKGILRSTLNKQKFVSDKPPDLGELRKLLITASTKYFVAVEEMIAEITNSHKRYNEGKEQYVSYAKDYFGRD